MEKINDAMVVVTQPLPQIMRGIFMTKKFSSKITVFSFFAACLLVLYNFNPYGWSDLTYNYNMSLQNICKILNIRLNEWGGSSKFLFYQLCFFALF